MAAKKCRKESGFTLIELMVALLVLSIVIVGYIGANIMAQRNTEEMHERTLAIQDANRTIEQMRNASRTGLFPGNVTAAFPHNEIVAGVSSLRNEEIRVAYANAAANPLVVTVTVTWLSYTQRQDIETVRTYITQR